MSIKGNKTVNVTIGDMTKPVTAEFNYWPGTPDVMYMPNGDPGYPGDAPDLELTALWFGDGANSLKAVNVLAYLTADEVTEIENAIIEEGVEFDEDGGY